MRDEGTYFDRETNLVYNWHRYRDPSDGRFIQADPLGLYGGDLSLYVLRGNNPLSYIDPFGLQIAPGGGAAGGLLGGSGAAGGGILGGSGGSGAVGSNKNIAQGLTNLINKIKSLFCDDDNDPCNPPEGTRCYEGPDYGKPHAGASPHYHIYEMQRRRSDNVCYWRYLGGKMGRGVLTELPPGMQPCSSYPGFVGRGGT